MRLTTPYRVLGTLPDNLFAPLKKEICSTTEWDLDTRRQDLFGVHKDTKSIILKFKFVLLNSWIFSIRPINEFRTPTQCSDPSSRFLEY